MDEKDQKPLSVGDILDQLVKPSVVMGHTGAGSQQMPKEAPVQEKKILNSAEISLPQIGKMNGAGLPRLNTVGETKIEEQKLLIRTMAGDLEMLKRGQKPFGVQLGTVKPGIPDTSSQAEIKSRVEVSQEIAPQPLPKIPISFPSLPPADDYPSSNSLPLELAPEMPLIRNFNQSQQLEPNPKSTRGLPPSLPSIRPGAKTPEIFSIKDEIHVPHDEDDLLPPFPGAPIPKKIPKTQEEKLEYGVIARVISSGMTVGIVSTLVVATAAYFLLSFFFFNNDAVSIPTPSPTVSETPKPVFNELESIFGIYSSVTATLSEDKSTAVVGLVEFIKNQSIPKKEFRRLILRSNDKESLFFTEVLDRLNISYPAEFKDRISDNNVALLYGQDELFDTEQASERRMVFIVEVKDEAGILDLMSKWESTMPSDFSKIFQLDPSKEATRIFLSNYRRSVHIRYKNFPLPDRSIDYTILRSLGGRKYLLITNSREAMFSPADKIMGL